MIESTELGAILDQLKSTPSETLESDVLEFKLYASENSLHNPESVTVVGPTTCVVRKM